MAGGSSLLLENWHANLEKDEASARECIVDDRGAHRYPAVDAEARRVARGLQASGVSKGERVALMVGPGAEFIAAFFGVLLAGGCVVILSPIHPPAESIYVCTDARVNTLLVGRGMKDKADGVVGGTWSQKLLGDVARAGDDERALPEVLGSDAALQLYTSGTTGRPKGAILTHDNLGIQQRLLGEAWRLDRSSTLLHALPLHHLHGIGISLLATIGAGGGVRFVSPFDAATVWNDMERATVFMAVPTMYAKLLGAWDEADEKTRARWSRNASALVLCTSGSAALPPSIGERWRAIAGRYPLERFGMTEVGVALSNPFAETARRPGTIGRPLPTVDLRVVREDGFVVTGAVTGAGETESGELQLRGPSIFAGYFGRDDATKDSFAPADDAGDPWFKTGDTVAYDDAGYVRVLGRTSVDILKSGGYKLSALDIEATLREHPAVLDVAVIGLPDPTWGERVAAVVIARPGRAAECTGEVLGAFAREKLAAYKVPRAWFLRDELPRTAVGKVKKKELAIEIASADSADSADTGGATK